MQEIKKPKKPIIFYYTLVLVALLVINFFLMPFVAQRQVQEVDYGTFMKMTEEKEIGKVEVQEVIRKGKGNFSRNVIPA